MTPARSTRRSGPRSSRPRTVCSPTTNTGASWTPWSPARGPAPPCSPTCSPRPRRSTLISSWELLTKVGGAYVLDEALRPAFFAAAKNLNSDYEHGRTLLSIVERGELPRPVVLAVLESAKDISSDHELSELLIAVISKVKMDDTIRAAIREDAGSIGSQYDRGRVFEALSRD